MRVPWSDRRRRSAGVSSALPQVDWPATTPRPPTRHRPLAPAERRGPAIRRPSGAIRATGRATCRARRSPTKGGSVEASKRAGLPAPAPPAACRGCARAGRRAHLGDSSPRPCSRVSNQCSTRLAVQRTRGAPPARKVFAVHPWRGADARGLFADGGGQAGFLDVSDAMTTWGVAPREVAECSPISRAVSPGDRAGNPADVEVVDRHAGKAPVESFHERRMDHLDGPSAHLPVGLADHVALELGHDAVVAGSRWVRLNVGQVRRQGSTSATGRAARLIPRAVGAVERFTVAGALASCEPRTSPRPPESRVSSGREVRPARTGEQAGRTACVVGAARNAQIAGPHGVRPAAGSCW